jgi:hypothetical protein
MRGSTHEANDIQQKSRTHQSQSSAITFHSGLRWVSSGLFLNEKTNAVMTKKSGWKQTQLAALDRGQKVTVKEGLRFHSGGRGRWECDLRVCGKRRHPGLGKFPAVGIKTAETKLNRLRLEAENGIDRIAKASPIDMGEALHRAIKIGDIALLWFAEHRTTMKNEGEKTSY